MNIGLVGTGNVAWHLAKGFDEVDSPITGVFSRNKKSQTTFAKNFNIKPFSLEELASCDVVICAVSDSAVVEVVDSLSSESIVAYTSGSVSLETISHPNSGVFYPLQTFTKGNPVNLFEVPFFIEGKSNKIAKTLFDLAWKLSRKVEFADSKKRGELHLAAVFANNFTNHMFVIAEQYLKEKEISFNHLVPLIQESAKKLTENSPSNIQTGPAKRRDQNIIKNHLAKLSGEEKEIYTLISKSIQKKYNEKL